MQQFIYTKETAEAANHTFNMEVDQFLRNWIADNEGEILLRFEQSLAEYLANDALRDFFLHSNHPLQHLLRQPAIARHLARNVNEVYFDLFTGDPLLAPVEQRIYNLAHRMDSEKMHVPFRSVQPCKQSEAGDNLDVSTYPAESEQIRYNSGNHFSSRPANANVFDENSKHCRAKSAGNLTILFERGFLEDRLHDIKETTLALHNAGETALQFFVICSRHSPKEGHFGTSLVIMDPSNPHFPKRVLVCDTLLKELPQHPRWWHHFIAEYANVFGDAIAEIIEDLSHPLQKVNIKGDDPFRHDWDCPYYVTSMTDALADLVLTAPELIVNGDLKEIHHEMKRVMQDYYTPELTIKDREDIKYINRLKRWNSGQALIKELMFDMMRNSAYEV